MQGVKINKIKVIELFGGIGAFTQALKGLDVDFEVVDYVEIDKFAVKSYNAINEKNFTPQDIKEWDKELEADLIMHGSPCQDFSLDGLQKGGNEGSETRSSLMYESVRIISKIKPKYVIWENVKGVLAPKHKYNFEKYLQKMQDLGYENFYQVLNAKDYGIPQNRERIFVVSILDGGKYEFPIKEPLKLTFRDLLDKPVNSKYDLTLEQVERARNSNYHSYRDSEILGDISPCLKVGGSQKFYKKSDESGYRKLTPKECWRLMGFSDEAFEKARAVNSDTQLYKQAGNSIVVNVLQEILKNLFGDANAKS